MALLGLSSRTRSLFGRAIGQTVWSKQTYLSISRKRNVFHRPFNTGELRMLVCVHSIADVGETNEDIIAEAYVLDCTTLGTLLL